MRLSTLHQNITIPVKVNDTAEISVFCMVLEEKKKIHDILGKWMAKGIWKCPNEISIMNSISIFCLLFLSFPTWFYYLSNQTVNESGLLWSRVDPCTIRLERTGTIFGTQTRYIWKTRTHPLSLDILLLLWFSYVFLPISIYYHVVSEQTSRVWFWIDKLTIQERVASRPRPEARSGLDPCTRFCSQAHHIP